MFPSPTEPLVAAWLPWDEGIAAWQLSLTSAAEQFRIGLPNSNYFWGGEREGFNPFETLYLILSREAESGM